jgi:hypothetical protein
MPNDGIQAGDESQAGFEVIRCYRARALAHLKRFAEAVAEAQGCGAKPRDAFDVTCAYSLLSAAALQDAKLTPSERDKLSEAPALREIELLAGLDWKNGWLLEPLKTDKDLDPLRARPDFIALVKRAEKARLDDALPDLDRKSLDLTIGELAQLCRDAAAVADSSADDFNPC